MTGGGYPDAYTGGYTTPSYPQPAVTVRATYPATDGTRPEDVTVDWKDPPSTATIIEVIEVLAAVAAGRSRAGIRAVLAEPPTPNGVSEATRRALEETTTQLARPFCGAKGPGHDRDGHSCSLYTFHEPIEPDGRHHRCACGGIFSADEETPDVPGRNPQRKERR